MPDSGSVPDGQPKTAMPKTVGTAQRQNPRSGSPLRFWWHAPHPLPPPPLLHHHRWGMVLRTPSDGDSATATVDDGQGSPKPETPCFIGKMAPLKSQGNATDDVETKAKMDTVETAGHRPNVP
ncbi:unnamed protein product [Gemmata massiliana]|uniref:Uncharacterized protein n=1 Tax=Gemmata massiliana TaxID=1210884 RepID=A0A6P2CWT6_9BACT|nr:unnamed protein product [Gemmata massiliana]